MTWLGSGEGRILHQACRLAIAWLLFLLFPVWAQVVTLRLDLAGTSAFHVRHPTLLARQGYGVNYSFEAPDAQEVSFHRATPQAEFDTITLEAAAGEIIEVRFSKPDERFSMIIHQIAGSLLGVWNAPPTEKTLPAPPVDAEVRRRFALTTELFAAAREALGLKDFRGGQTGTVTLQLGGVEDLVLRSGGADVEYEYTFFALAQDAMVEELKVAVSGATFTVEVGSGRLLVQRQSTTADGQRTIAHLSIEGGSWQGVQEIRRPGERPTSTDLTRAEAEQLLREGLSHLRAARNHFGVTFGRDLAAYRLP